MRRIVRLPVSKATSAALARLTAAVKAAAEPAQKAASLWKRKPKAVFDDVRATLETMAAGRGRCMYCSASRRDRPAMSSFVRGCPPSSRGMVYRPGSDGAGTPPVRRENPSPQTRRRSPAGVAA